MARQVDVRFLPVFRTADTGGGDGARDFGLDGVDLDRDLLGDLDGNDIANLDLFEIVRRFS